VIDQTDLRLVEWVRSVLPGSDVSLEAPAASQGRSGIDLYLLSLGAAPPLRGLERSPLQFSLHYLVTSWDSEPLRAHKALGDLVCAAMQEAEFEVQFDPSGVPWGALGVAPRPAILLKVPARLVLPEPSTALVRKPLVLQAGPISRLSGRVVGPDDVPIAGARVHVAALNLSVRTDNDGRFALPVPSRAQQIHVTARGRALSLKAEPSPDGAPLIIRFDPREV
jgi:hypothetical protein